MKSFLTQPILKFWVGIGSIGLLVGAINRLILVLFTSHTTPETTPLLLGESFLVGLRFDLSLVCFFIAIPLVLSALWYVVLGRLTLWWVWASIPLVGLVFSIGFNLADIDFWPYFGNRLTKSAFAWKDTPLMSFQIVWQTYPVLTYTIILISISTGMWWLTKKLIESIEAKTVEIKIMGRFLAFILLISLCFLGMRGRVAEKSPLVVGVAYFSSDVYANQLALNSLYTFFASVVNDDQSEEKILTLLTEEEASLQAESYFQHYRKSYQPAFGFTDTSIISSKPTYVNIVVILMESFTARVVKPIDSLGFRYDITPNFDQMTKAGQLYTSFFSNANHTGHGLFQTVTGFPNPPGSSMTKRENAQVSYHSFAEQLKEKGYQTGFFTTHDPHFDNMQGFMRQNGYEDIVSEFDFPAEQKLSTLGVPDHILLDKLVDWMRFQDQKGKSFAAVALTSSNHGPWFIPEPAPISLLPDTVPDYKRWNAFRYSDYAIGRFYEQVKQTPFFKNTVFLFVADHGSYHDAGLPLAPSQFFVPLLIIDGTGNLSPWIIPGKKVEFTASQIDIAPSILDLIGGTHSHHFMGTSLFRYPIHRGVPVMFDATLGWIQGRTFYMFGSGMPENAYDWFTLKPQENPIIDRVSAERNVKMMYQLTLKKVLTREIGNMTQRGQHD